MDKKSIKSGNSDMALDMTEIEILLQRRYNCLLEIRRLTQEMLDTVSRGDEVSLSLMLDMRAEEIEKFVFCQEEIWKKAAKGPRDAEVIKRIMNTDPEEGLAAEKAEERLAYQIRKKTVDLISEVQQLNKLLGRRLNVDQPR